MLDDPREATDSIMLSMGVVELAHCVLSASESVSQLLLVSPAVGNGRFLFIFVGIEGDVTATSWAHQRREPHNHSGIFACRSDDIILHEELQ